MPLTPGVGVTGPVVPKYDTDTYPSHQAIYGLGGWREVADAATRNALTTSFPLRCEQGMAVMLDDGTLWILNAPPWAGDDTDWTQFAGGSVQLGGQTTSATPVNLLPDGSGGGFPLVRPGFVYGFTATIVGVKNDGSAAAFLIRNGLVANVGGTTAIIGAIGTIGADINAPAWAVAITADDADDTLQVAVTGATSTTINWVCRLDYVEVGFT